jgi:hypothetical protein
MRTTAANSSKQQRDSRNTDKGEERPRPMNDTNDDDDDDDNDDEVICRLMMIFSLL